MRYAGLLWDVDWIRYNGVFAWHAQCKTEELEVIRKISDLKVDEIVQMQERGVNPLTTIRL